MKRWYSFILSDFLSSPFEETIAVNLWGLEAPTTRDKTDLYLESSRNIGEDDDDDDDDDDDGDDDADSDGGLWRMSGWDDCLYWIMMDTWTSF